MPAKLESKITGREIRKIINNVDWATFWAEVHSAAIERIVPYALARAESRNRYR
jgi:hypothetical protein